MYHKNGNHLLTEGPQWRKSVGTHRRAGGGVGANITWSKRGLRATGSISMNIGGIKQSYNTSGRVTTSIPGTGLRWVSNPAAQRRKKERAAAREKAMKERNNTRIAKHSAKEFAAIESEISSFENYCTAAVSLHADALSKYEKKSYNESNINAIDKEVDKILNTMGNIWDSYDSVTDLFFKSHTISTKRDGEASYTLKKFYDKEYQDLKESLRVATGVLFPVVVNLEYIGVVYYIEEIIKQVESGKPALKLFDIIDKLEEQCIQLDKAVNYRYPYTNIKSAMHEGYYAAKNAKEMKKTAKAFLGHAKDLKKQIANQQQEEFEILGADEIKKIENKKITFEKIQKEIEQNKDKIKEIDKWLKSKKGFASFAKSMGKLTIFTVGTFFLSAAGAGIAGATGGWLGAIGLLAGKGMQTVYHKFKSDEKKTVRYKKTLEQYIKHVKQYKDDAIKELSPKGLASTYALYVKWLEVNLESAETHGRVIDKGLKNMKSHVKEAAETDNNMGELYEDFKDIDSHFLVD